MWAKISLILAGLTVLGFVIVGTSGTMFDKFLHKLQSPDRYQLSEHYRAEIEVSNALAADPTDAAAWLRAAAFELNDNSPYGAAFCLTSAEAHGALAADLKPLQERLKNVEGRWTTLYHAFLANDRYTDGKNVYTDIYPVLGRLRGDDSQTPLTGKARYDYDLLEAHLLLKEGRRDEARQLLRELKAQTGPLQGLATYLFAKTHLREANLKPAHEAFNDFIKHFPTDRLAAYAQLELGDIALAGGDTQAAEQSFTQVMESSPTSAQAHAAMLAMLDITFGVVPEKAPATTEDPGDALFDLGGGDPSADLDQPKEGAGESAPMTVASPPSPPQATITGLDPRLIPDNMEGWNLYGDLFITAHNTLAVQRRAIALYQELLVPDPMPLKIWDVLTPASALGWAQALADAGYVKGAIRLCDWGVREPNFPDERVQLAQLRGRLQIGQGYYTEARTGLEAARTALAESADVALIDYEIARTWRLSRNAGRARPWYLKAAQGEDRDLAADATAQAAWAAAQSGDWATSLSDYKRIINSWPDSVYADVGREHLLSEQLQAGNRQQARTYAAELAATAQKGARFLKGTYFGLKLGSEEVDWGAFQQRYPFTVYGVYVSQKLARTYADFNTERMAIDLTFRQLRQQERSIAGAALQAGLWDIAQAEWEAGGAATPEAFALMADALFTADKNHPRETILTAQEFFDRGGQAEVAPGWTLLLMEAAYPLDYVAEVEAQAVAYNFPPGLLLGIIRQESYFNPKATSTAGARGLMQLMPTTAKWAGKQLGKGTIGTEQMTDPSLNLEMACWHLDFLRKAVGGSFGLLLAAHNGGPGNLAKWQESIPTSASADEELFLELIPNRESREFVKYVRANQAVYETRLAHRGDAVVF